MPLKFVAVRDEEDCLTLISSVASSPYAKQIDKMAAIETLQRAVDAADLAPRPVSCCRSWGRIDSDSGPEEKAQRVPGGATPTAFRETLKAWGADAVDRGSVIRCAVDNLFLDKATGQTDGEMQADFWREAELYTACGPEAAVEFRKRVAKRRQSSRVERPPGAADCFHDWVDTNNGDGRTKRTCRLCGEFYGYMQEAQQ